LENLFQGCLADGVFANVKLPLVVFNQTKQIPDRLVLARNSELEIVATLFNEVNLLKLSSQDRYYLNAHLQGKDVVNKILESDSAASYLRFKVKVGAYSTLLYLC
jgi:S-adenosylmethionine:tRNA-ribosyltransferase-isomerase (queuine synthetase)